VLKGVKWSELNAVTATTMKIASTVSLTPTMIAFARALSRTPTIRSHVIAMTIATATRLKVPPSSGESAIASGILKPNVTSRNSLRFAPQPTATAATETPYSRIRSQPMIHATSSPSVA
jgi:hypothetical protein